MQKPQIINAFAGDSLSLRITIFDDLLDAFDPDDFSITTATLYVPSQDVEIAGVVSENVVSFFIESTTLPTAGEYPFYAQISGATACFTIAHGTLSLKALPQ